LVHPLGKPDGKTYHRIEPSGVIRRDPSRRRAAAVGVVCVPADTRCFAYGSAVPTRRKLTSDLPRTQSARLAHADERLRVEAMLATSADGLKTGELANERAHERFTQPTGRGRRDCVGDEGTPPRHTPTRRVGFTRKQEGCGTERPSVRACGCADGPSRTCVGLNRVPSLPTAESELVIEWRS
jgi:hypothetical protein